MYKQKGKTLYIEVFLNYNKLLPKLIFPQDNGEKSERVKDYSKEYNIYSLK